MPHHAVPVAVVEHKLVASLARQGHVDGVHRIVVVATAAGHHGVVAQDFPTRFVAPVVGHDRHFARDEPFSGLLWLHHKSVVGRVVVVFRDGQLERFDAVQVVGAKHHQGGFVGGQRPRPGRGKYGLARHLHFQGELVGAFGPEVPDFRDDGGWTAAANQLATDKGFERHILRHLGNQGEFPVGFHVLECARVVAHALNQVHVVADHKRGRRPARHAGVGRPLGPRIGRGVVRPEFTEVHGRV